MIAIGIGANLQHLQYGSPRRTCGAALDRLMIKGLDINKCSHWYGSAPVLDVNHGSQEDQPWYVNAVFSVKTTLNARELLDLLLGVEADFGRIRSIANAPRTLDLDIVTYNDQIIEDDHLELPHPRLDQRAFVVLPLADLAPNWSHPVSKQTIASMIENLPEGQDIHLMADSDGLFQTEWTVNSQ